MSKTPISVRLNKILSTPDTSIYKEDGKWMIALWSNDSNDVIVTGDTLDEAIGNYFTATKNTKTRKRAPSVSQSESNDESVANG